jgi:hypothetical protein
MMRRLGVSATPVACLTAVLAIGCGCADSEQPVGESRSPATIAQPTRAQYDAAGLSSFPFAPQRRRIDLGAPSFSNPTAIDNPLNPIAEIPSALVLGEVDGEPLRIEITLLPETRAIEWAGQLVENAVSQFVAYVGGRMREVAIDYYAQADDGNVWYFGEDVFNYADDGHIGDMDGAWLAGRDGPAGMITAARPQLGDVYRSENIPGLVFEESTVKRVGATVEGPRGPVTGAYVIDEHHPDGPEIKKFAPGYGEFFTRDGRDFEQLALAVPIDALPGAVPRELERIAANAAAIFDASPARDWRAATEALDGMRADWAAFRNGEVPRLLAGQMTGALDALGRAINARDPIESRLAAIGVAVAGLDFQLRHRPPAVIDLGRLDLQAAMLVVDAGARDIPAIRSDVANLDWIRDRIAHTLDAPVRSRVDTELVELVAATGDEDLRAVREHAVALRDALARTKKAPG